MDQSLFFVEIHLAPLGASPVALSPIVKQFLSY